MISLSVIMSSKKKSKNKRLQEAHLTSPQFINDIHEHCQSTRRPSLTTALVDVTPNVSRSSSSRIIQQVRSHSSLVLIDPLQIRFQHSRIRPYFSGCGRSVKETLEEIRRGKLRPEELPPIQVLEINNNNNQGSCYFSLNNRRLWVLKQCRKEGLLDNPTYNNMITVRVRLPKSEKERERYCVQKCSLEAKFMREAGGKSDDLQAKGEDGQNSL